jgi:RNA polymerase sigma-70 factor, ECF subfamily
VTAKEQQVIFDDWLTRHKGLLFKVVRAYAFTAMDQDDLFQEISIQVWHSIPGFRHACAESTWLYRVSLNTAVRWSRKERKHSPSASLEQVAHVLQERPVQADERLAWLYEQIQRLDPIDRSITLLLLDNCSYKEMATILGITESNVGVKINRIKKYLITQSKSNHYGI